MKRTICIVLSFLLIAAAVFCACACGADKDDVETTVESTTAPEESTTEEPSTLEKFTDVANPYPGKTEASAETTTKKAPEPTTAPRTTEPATEAVTYPSGPQMIGISSKGYDIIQENGITYVNGILIANKSYSLPSGYNPGGLLSNCSSAFSKMQAAAAEEGLNIYVSSGFRSYSSQNSIYNRYCAEDGQAAADRYSARPGHSEHQTGLAIDLNSIEYSFADTPEGQWVAANCYKYGFILRYPENKEAQTGYRYEPWHIRYVGVDLATAITNSGLCLEEYLGITSAYH